MASEVAFDRPISARLVADIKTVANNALNRIGEPTEFTNKQEVRNAFREIHRVGELFEKCSRELQGKGYDDDAGELKYLDSYWLGFLFHRDRIRFDSSIEFQDVSDSSQQVAANLFVCIDSIIRQNDFLLGLKGLPAEINEFITTLNKNVDELKSQAASFLHDISYSSELKIDQKVIESLQSRWLTNDFLRLRYRIVEVADQPLTSNLTKVYEMLGSRELPCKSIWEIDDLSLAKALTLMPQGRSDEGLNREKVGDDNEYKMLPVKLKKMVAHFADSFRALNKINRQANFVRKALLKKNKSSF